MKNIPIERTLAYKFPEITIEWDSDKNCNITPSTIASMSNQKVWWKCKNNHSWKTTVYHRTKSKSGCPFCKGSRATEVDNLEVKFPFIAKEWHPIKNNNLTPRQIRPFSHVQAWWLCFNKHEWKVEVASRTLARSRCPYCAGCVATTSNNLAVLYPELLKEWDYSKNTILPTSVLSKSNLKVWWICSKKHSWSALISSRTGSKRGCPYCSHQIATIETSLSTLYPNLVLEWHPTKNGRLTPDSVLPGGYNLIWWMCSKGHEWQTRIYHRTSNKTGCPYCCFTHTNPEKLVESKLNLIKYNKYPLENSSIKYQPDFKLSDNLYLNVDGLYWHSEINKSKDYHYKLREAFELENKRILQFYEDEIYNKWDIVESIINNSLGKTNIKINGRNCTISSINQHQATEFYNTNHLMGTINFASHFGLIYNNELMACISIRNTNNILEISRFATKLNISVRGGFSKLLSHVIKLYNPSKVISFCDLRYATGKSYEKLGFKRVSISQGWCWTDCKITYNRLACIAQNNKSEFDNAKEKNWYKIYDAGQAKYVLEM